MKRCEVKDSEKVMDCCWLIARGSLESAYSWDSKRAGKTAIVDDGNSVE